MIWSRRTMPKETTLTRQLSSKLSLKTMSPPMLGTPRALPYCQMPSTTPSATQRTLLAFGP